MAISIEELLKPRYKVIADYPCSEFLVGDIFTFDDAESYDNPYDSKNGVFLNTVEKYPNIFKKLQWFEERRPEDMPEYIKRISLQKVISNTAIKIGDVVKVEWAYDYFDKEKFSEIKMLGFFTDLEDGMSDFNYDQDCFAPSTKEEYEASTKAKQ